MSEVVKLTQKKVHSLLQVIFSSGFLAAMSTAFVLYINSSFLETLVPKDWVGVLYATAYVATFAVVHNYTKVIARLKNHVALLGVLGLESLMLLILAWNAHPVLSVAAFIVFVTLYNAAVINFDILLESHTKNAETGRVRGMFWTAASLGISIGPIFSGFLTDYYGFAAAYLAAALVLLPAWLLIFFTYRNGNHVEKYKRHHPLFATIWRIHRNRNLRGIFFLAFTLFFFYSWMVIYTPIYLVEQGFTWEQIGQMFTVMLMAFVLVEYPAGWLADKYFGEMEMMTLGLVIMGLAVFALLTVSSFWVMMAVLFCSRVGAALVEIMRDTYFYKKIDQDDLDLIDLFRNMQAAANIVSPLLASLLLLLGFGIPALFVILGLFLFAASVVPFTMQDTR